MKIEKHTIKDFLYGMLLTLISAVIVFGLIYLFVG